MKHNNETIIKVLLTLCESLNHPNTGVLSIMAAEYEVLRNTKK